MLMRSLPRTHEILVDEVVKNNNYFTTTAWVALKHESYIVFAIVKPPFIR